MAEAVQKGILQKVDFSLSLSSLPQLERMKSPLWKYSPLAGLDFSVQVSEDVLLKVGLTEPMAWLVGLETW